MRPCWKSPSPSVSTCFLYSMSAVRLSGCQSDWKRCSCISVWAERPRSRLGDTREREQQTAGQFITYRGVPCVVCSDLQQCRHTLHEHRFPAPSTKPSLIWLRRWRGTLYLRAAVYRRGQRPPKGLGTNHTPSIVFRHLPPNSARFSYATKSVSAFRKVRVLIRLWEQPSAQART